MNPKDIAMLITEDPDIADEKCQHDWSKRFTYRGYRKTYPKQLAKRPSRPKYPASKCSKCGMVRIRMSAAPLWYRYIKPKEEMVEANQQTMSDGTNPKDIARLITEDPDVPTASDIGMLSPLMSKTTYSCEAPAHKLISAS
jgi:sortase (surface protein transpeptidase)